jgi:hypothetical protein
MLTKIEYNVKITFKSPKTPEMSLNFGYVFQFTGDLMGVQVSLQFLVPSVML